MPHPVPYQGSKRQLAAAILGEVDGRHFRRLYEPFAGSAAITLAAATAGIADEYVVNDMSEPLAGLWSAVVERPSHLADDYESVWLGQFEDPGHFARIRAEYNTGHDPARLLYLLARCVKNAPRWNNKGEFNQSPDKRRNGMRPRRMRQQVMGASWLLAGKTVVTAGDFRHSIASATSRDLVYMDPPYEGVQGRDRRYEYQMERSALVEALSDLNDRGVPFLVSYDGRTGDKTYGEPLPNALAHRLELDAGRSSQATLHGRDDRTFESLYISWSLVGGSHATPTPQALTMGL